VCCAPWRPQVAWVALCTIGYLSRLRKAGVVGRSCLRERLGRLWGSPNRSAFDEEFFTIRSWFDHVTKLH
jgi:hypothetical protein